MSSRPAQIANRLLALRGQPGEVFLYPHIDTDGDALGSSLALLRSLRQIDVRARLLLDEPVPERLKFLPALDLIETGAELAAECAAKQKLALLIDCAEAERTGRRRALVEQAEQIAAIDHHIDASQSGGLFWIDPTAAAAGEMVFDLICQLGKTARAELIDDTNAFLLMTAVVSDTGSFIFSNTSARTFRVAASLMARPVDLRQITYQLFDLTSQERLRLMGRLFTDAQFYLSGRLVLATASQHLLDEYGATDQDLDGVINHLRNVGGVEAAFLIREMNDSSLRVSIRGSDSFNAAEFAGGFGGGGHRKAAGLVLKGLTLAEAAALIRDKAGERLSKR